MPGESHGQRSLADYSPWGLKESDITAVTYHTCMLAKNTQSTLVKKRDFDDNIGSAHLFIPQIVAEY